MHREVRDSEPAVPVAGHGSPWKRRAVYLLLFSLISTLFAVLYFIAYRTIINEIRNHAMGVALAVPAAVEGETLLEIREEEDMERDEFSQVQGLLDRIERLNPDIRYIYLMRRSADPGALPSNYEYVVDLSEEDDNGNGLIDPEETSNPPGTPYDASAWPDLVLAWERPGADPEVSPDPPYPDLMSGYAPVVDRVGNTVAVVGVDITARTVAAKVLGVRAVMVSVWFLLCFLSGWVLVSYFREKRHTGEMEELVVQLREAMASVKTLSGLLPICSGCKKIRDDGGYWEQVETYVSSHSEATFTHSLCPDCLKQLYPEQYERLKRKGLVRYVPRKEGGG